MLNSYVTFDPFMPIDSAIVEDIRTFLKENRSETVAVRNIQLLEAFLTDPACHGTNPDQNDENSAAVQEHRRVRVHRLILLGAWVMEHCNTRADLTKLITDELDAFLDQGKHAEHHKHLIKDVLS